MNIQSYLEKQFSESTIPYYVKDENGVYKDINQALLLDCKKEIFSEIVGHKDIDLWDGQASSFHINDQKIILRKNSSLYIEDILFENRKRFYLSFKSPLLSSTGKVIGICGISFPIYYLVPDELSESIEQLQYFTLNNDIY